MKTGTIKSAREGPNGRSRFLPSRFYAEQATVNNSLPVQEKKLRDYCKREGLDVLKMFVDPGESARTTDRPKFQLMLAYCRAHRRKVSHVLVADLSRLSRSVQDQGYTIALLNQLGIKLESVDEPMTGDSAVGQLTRNMIGTFNQFFSDSLSERTRYRMRAAVSAGRFPWPAPIGYLNIDKKLCADPERAPFVRQAFELVASGRFATGDAVLKLITSLGFTTKKGRRLTKQSFARMLSNPLYTGWIVSGDIRVLGNHDFIVSEELFQSVQERINGKSRPHKKLNEDFPLRGVVRCATCGKPLTAGWARGRKNKRYPRYWCWEETCKAVGVRREDLEGQFVNLLSRMQPTAELLAQLPERAAAHWQARKARIAVDARTLNNSLAVETTLNQKAIMAKLNGTLSDADFDSVKVLITEKISGIESQIKALDCERSTMDDLLQQTQTEAVDLVGAWQKGNVNQRQELATAFFPEGLVFSHEKVFFEPANVVIQQMVWRFVTDEIDFGVPDGI
jgi:DNA invertase Pin-like site-specific DNA recombinase